MLFILRRKGEKISENDLDKEKESWGRLRLGNKNEERVRSKFYFLFFIEKFVINDGC